MNSWRFIPFTRYNPYLKTALNEVLIEVVSQTNQPIFWLSGWDRDCINLGVSQDYSQVIDRDRVQEEGIAITRRQSGGGATFLTKDGEITWGIIVPEHFFDKDINGIYEEVCSWLVEELQNNTIDAFFKPINDIRTPRGKISGSTLRREKGVVYVGGTLLYREDKEKMNKYLRPEQDYLKKERIDEKKKDITSITKESSLNFEESQELLKKAFLPQEYEEKPLGEDELLKAKNLEKQYSSKEWIENAKK